jgi:hypothetical protein
LTVTEEVVFEHPVDESVKVNVTLPAATPVTTPASVTVAIPVLLLTHVPPVVGERVAVLPTQTEAGEETTGVGFTVTVLVALVGVHDPAAVAVAVMVVVPLKPGVQVITPVAGLMVPAPALELV